MGIEELQSCAHSKQKRVSKYGKKIGKKGHQKVNTGRNRVAQRKKHSYSPEYHRERFTPLYHSDEYKPTIVGED